MNKSQLVESIATKTGFTKKDSEKALAAVLESVEKALVKGDKVQLIGFGTFGTKKRAARTGRNPQPSRFPHPRSFLSLRLLLLRRRSTRNKRSFGKLFPEAAGGADAA